MNWVDWVILAVAAVSVFAGFMDGLVKTILSLASVFVAFIGASRFALPMGTFLENYMSPKIAHPAGFAVVFFLVLVAFALVGFLIRKALEKLSLSWLDRVLGGAGGLARAAIILGVVAVLVDGFGPFRVTRESITFPYALKSGDVLLSLVPENVKSRLQWKRSDARANESRPGNSESKKDDDTI